MPRTNAEPAALGLRLARAGISPGTAAAGELDSEQFLAAGVPPVLLTHLPRL